MHGAARPIAETLAGPWRAFRRLKARAWVKMDIDRYDLSSDRADISVAHLWSTYAASHRMGRSVQHDADDMGQLMTAFVYELPPEDYEDEWNPSAPIPRRAREDLTCSQCRDRALLRCYHAHELVMGGEGGWREFSERVRTQDRHAGEDTEPVVVEPSNDVVVFETFNGVEEVGALPEWLMVASTKPNLMCEFDGADGDLLLADGQAPTEISGEQDGAGSDERRVHDLEVGVVQRKVRLGRAHQRHEVKHVGRSRLNSRVCWWVGHLPMIGLGEWMRSKTAYPAPSSATA